MLFKTLIYLVAGTLFGFGLALSGMTDPEVVTGFLDILGAWDLTLIFVMLGGIAVTSIGYQLIFKQNKPVFDKQFSVPSNKAIDRPLILGALLFGLGWGLYGFCPGPALASIASLEPQTFAFVAAMAVGMLLADRFKSLIH